MNRSIGKIAVQVSSALAFIFVGYANGATCPTEIKQNKEGYWYSDQAPGWKSKTKTPENITVNVKDFGGVVYSPRHKRFACVYKTSDKKWFALVSKKLSNFEVKIDKQAKDDSGKEPAWRYSKRYKDYACGMPFTSKLSKCRFELKKIKNSAKKTHRHHSKLNKKTKIHKKEKTNPTHKKKMEKTISSQQKNNLSQSFLEPPRATMTAQTTSNKKDKIASLLK